jgi:hypothetical protein
MLALLNTAPEPQQILDAVAADAIVSDCIIHAVQNGEVDALNDLGRFRRRSHRGTRAESQALQYLGVSLEEHGFEWEERSNQARFLNPTRFGAPVRFVYCRGGLRAPSSNFGINPKGPFTDDLVNENLMQTALFPFTATTPSTQSQPLFEMVRNIWVMADATVAGRLAVYLAYPIELQRDPANRLRMILVCPQARLLWEGSVADSVEPLAERPQAQPIEEPMFEERDDEAAQS